MTIVDKAKEVNNILFNVQKSPVIKEQQAGFFIKSSDFNSIRTLFVDHLLDAAKFDFTPSADLSNASIFQEPDAQLQILSLRAEITKLAHEQRMSTDGPTRAALNNKRQQLESKLLKLEE